LLKRACDVDDLEGFDAPAAHPLQRVDEVIHEGLHLCEINCLAVHQLLQGPHPVLLADVITGRIERPFEKRGATLPHRVFCCFGAVLRWRLLLSITLSTPTNTTLTRTARVFAVGCQQLRRVLHGEVSHFLGGEDGSDDRRG